MIGHKFDDGPSTNFPDISTMDQVQDPISVLLMLILPCHHVYHLRSPKLRRQIIRGMMRVKLGNAIPVRPDKSEVVNQAWDLG